MADARKLTNWIWGLVSAVLLFVVVAHAVAPMATEHGQGRGSAFSASNAEVSLKSGTRAAVAKETVRLDPQGPLPVLSAIVAKLAVQPAPSAPVDLPSAAPLVAAAALHPISPRAPPAA